MAKRKDRDESAAVAPGAGAVLPAGPAASAGEWQVPAKLSRVSLGVIIGVVVVMNLPMIHYYVFRQLPKATVAVPFSDDYSNAATVDQNYFSTGGFWRVVPTANGTELLSPGVKNNPLWLKAALPEDVAVEFDARSQSPEGDIKCEIFGDGSDHASGYILIHGGWNNSLSIIARLDEHGTSLAALQNLAQQRGSSDVVQTGVFTKDTRMRVEANPYPVQIGRTYHWRIERKGSKITWFIDGGKFMEFDDPFPLKGKGHDRFAFSSWDAQLYFDNLKITPL